MNQFHRGVLILTQREPIRTAQKRKEKKKTHLPIGRSAETSARRPSWSTEMCSGCRQTPASSPPAGPASWFDWTILTSSSWRRRNLQIDEKNRGGKLKKNVLLFPFNYCTEEGLKSVTRDI